MKRYPARTSIISASALLATSLLFPSVVLGADSYSFSATPGASGGQVVLNWKQLKADVQSYNVFYGTDPSKFEFGAVNIGGTGVGKDVSFTVNYLKPGVKYFFGLSPVSYKKASPPSIVTESVAKAGQVAPPPASSSPSRPVNPAPTATFTGVIPGDTFKGQKEITSGGAGAHHLSAKKGDKPGEVILTWDKAFSNIDNYSVVYGTGPGNFQYGARNIGNTTSFTVKSLNPGEKYYFALVPQKDGNAQYISAQVTSDATPGVVPVPAPAPTANVVPAQAPALTGPVQADSVNSQSKSAIKSSDVGLHHLSVKNGAKASEVVLDWKQAYKDVDNYDVVYGTEPGKFQYGAQNVGKTGEFVVKGLDPNKQYYFALVPKKGGQAQYVTQEVSTGGAGSAPASIQPPTAAPSVPGGAGGGSGGSSGGSSGGGLFGVPGLNLPGQSGQGSKGGASQQSSGQSESQGGSQQSGGSNPGGTKQESKQTKKETKKRGVKGIYTVLPWFLNLLGL